MHISVFEDGLIFNYFASYYKLKKKGAIYRLINNQK